MEFIKKNWRYIAIVSVVGVFLVWLFSEPGRTDAIISTLSGALSPFALGAAFAFVLNVPMRAFERLLKGIKHPTIRRTLALILTIIVVLLVMSAVFILLIPQLVQTIDTLVPKVKDFFLECETVIQKWLSENPELMDWIKENIGIEKLEFATLVQNVVSTVGNGVSTILIQTLSTLSKLAEAVVDFVIASIFSVYCLFQKEKLAQQGRKLVYAFLPSKMADGVVRVFRLSNSTFSNFLSGQCIEVCILGALFAIAMSIFRMPYIPLICVMIAVLAFIPIVGAWIACGIGAFLILIEDPAMALGFVVMFIVIQQLEGNLIYPRVVGTSIGLSGMWVLVAISIGGELMGVGGMFIMIPAVSVAYVLFSEVVNKRLQHRGVDPEKLRDQPPNLRRRFAKKKNKKEK